MLKKDIKQQELLDAIKRYEKEVRNSDFVSNVPGTTNICRFKASRRDKLVIVLLDGAFSDRQVDLLATAQRIVIADSTLSDNVDFYTTGVITEKRASELEIPLRQNGISVSFFDASKMEETEQFSTLLPEREELGIDNEVNPALFDYLAMSNDSSDIKNGFFYSLLLFEVYRNQPVTESEISERCQAKYGRKQADVAIALKALRQNGKITQLRKGGEFSLSNREQRVLEKAVKDSNAQEAEFRNKLELLTVKNKLKDSELLFETLKKEYLSKYTLFSKNEDIGEEMEKSGADGEGSLQSLLASLDESQKETLMVDLKQLCDNNDYLDQYGLVHSFLDLFHSDRYEGYIAKKECWVYFDTPVLANYLCLKSGFQEDLEIEWNDGDFISVNDLIGYKEESGCTIRFIVPHDYLQEVVGEFKKALQFSWFEQFEELPIPVETANVFYNYFQVVKKFKQYSGDDMDAFTFEAFAKQLGFQDTNSESIYFFKKNMSSLRYFLDKMGCETLDKVEVDYSIFDIVKNKYYWYLHDKKKDKSDTAINADIRQSLYITEQQQISKGAGKEFYIVSWDNTLYFLRDEVKIEKEIADKSYSIFKPGELAEKLAFRSFRINKDSVSNEVFTYANNSFNVSDKIKSLYDNILNPYFVSFGKSNGALVLAVLNMQKSSMEGAADGSSRGEKTALENIFLSIISELPRHNCSSQNLKDFLADKGNNSQVIPVFTQAFSDYKKDGKANVADKVCEMVKAYVSKDEKDIVI